MLTSQELAQNRVPAIRPEREELKYQLQSDTDTYQPRNEAERTLVRQLALAAIRLRRLEQVEEQLWQQDEPSLNQIDQCERIRASAERSFFRHYQALENLRKERSKSNPKPAPKHSEPIGQNKPEPAPKRDLQAELDALLCRSQSLAAIDAILRNRSPRKPHSEGGSL